ncbi:HalOD1 output domain-containing protein [Natrinema sp. SYSU A 869]|uniref:HalOD1 output domain-containing protein n=1 Tax=Natrinema sp. SYSU A 869 TaxID=2871694 RepID=UPI001CA3CC10|nr:HalOD1 output domain-containing protein [Natrinema sp. SYSU A 869]
MVSVVNAIASAENRSPIDIDPIYGSIEPKLLNSFSKCADESNGSPTVSLAFSHEGYRINVDNMGKIVLSRDETSSSSPSFIRPSSESSALEESSGEFTCHYDFEADHSLTVMLAKALAAIKNTRPTEITPLYESIDPKVLNIFGDYASERDEPSSVSLEFVHSDHRITVDERGKISIRESNTSSKISIRESNTGSKITDVVRDAWNSDPPLTAPR